MSRYIIMRIFFIETIMICKGEYEMPSAVLGSMEGHVDL